MKCFNSCVFSAAAFAISVLSSQSGLAVEHPLDPLVFQEYWMVLQVLEDEDRLDETTVFYDISLIEPSKARVWAYSQGDSFERKAKAVVGSEGRTAEAIIDLDRASLESWNVLEGVQPK